MISAQPPAVGIHRSGSGGDFDMLRPSIPVSARRSYSSGIDIDPSELEGGGVDGGWVGAGGGAGTGAGEASGLGLDLGAAMRPSSLVGTYSTIADGAGLVDGTVRDGYDGGGGAGGSSSSLSISVSHAAHRTTSSAPVAALPNAPVHNNGGSATPVQGISAVAPRVYHSPGTNAPGGYLSAGREAWHQKHGGHAHGHNGAVTTSVHERPFYGIIADGVHVHPYAVNIAYETHPAGLILVTDAMQAMGLPVGRHKLGELDVEIFHGAEDGHYEGLHAVIAGSDGTLAGAVVPLDECARNLLAFTGCPLTHALAAVTTHPATVLRLDGIVGALETGCWADITIIDDSFNVIQTWVAGQLSWKKE
jgi:hypothetical protein